MAIADAIEAILPDEPPGLMVIDIQDNLNLGSAILVIQALLELRDAGRATGDGNLINRRYWRTRRAP